MKNLHKLIILVILSFLSVSNVFGTNEYENCENNLGIEKYGNLNKTLYDKVTSLGSKLVAKYSTSSETVRLENINKVFSLISNLKKITKLNESQTQIIDLLGYHISCEMKKIGFTTTSSIDNKINTIVKNEFFTVNKKEIEKGETVNFSMFNKDLELRKLGFNGYCRIVDLTGKSFSSNHNTSDINYTQNTSASPKFTTTYALQCRKYLEGIQGSFGEDIEKITVIVKDKEYNDMDYKKVNETWDYGFYVIYENNDYDKDGTMEGCNEYGLAYPDTLCVLKLGNMYVSPKNFTMKTKFKAENLDYGYGEGVHRYVTMRYNKDVDGLFEKKTFVNQDIYMNGLIGYSQKELRFFEKICPGDGNENCIRYDTEVKKVPNNSFDYDALSCKDLFSFKTNSVENKTLGNKKWIELTELGGDGLNNICSKDGSDKQGLCALQLNKSKLKVFSSGIYYGFNGGSGDMLGFDGHYYGGIYVENKPTNSASFLTFGSLNRYKPEIINTFYPSGSYNSKGEALGTSLPSSYNLVIEGNKIDLNNLEFQTRCVGY